MYIVQLKEANLKVGYISQKPKFFMTFWRRQNCGGKEKSGFLGDGLIGREPAYSTRGRACVPISAIHTQSRIWLRTSVTLGVGSQREKLEVSRAK